MAVEPVESIVAATEARSRRRTAVPDPHSLHRPTVAAFLGRTERGPLNEPVVLESFEDYRRAFGGPVPFSHVPLAVQQYFSNGGRIAVVVRLANRATRALLEVPAGREKLRLLARRPGSRESLRVSIDYDGIENDERRFNLVVQRVGRPGAQLVEDQELFPAISIDGSDRRFVVDALQGSELVSLLGPLPTRRPDATAPKHPGEAVPYIGLASPGTDGDELTDYDIVGSNEEGTGLFALDGIECVDLLSLPPPPSRDFGATVFLAAERYAKRRRAMLIWDPPWAWRTVDEALLGMRASGLAGRNAFTYFPRLRPRAELARYPAGVHASGAIAGMLARRDEECGRRPADGDRPAVKASLTTAVEVSDKHAAALHRSGVNAFVRAQGGQVVMHGNVCLAPRDDVSTRWQRLDVRRTTLFVLGALERGTEWVLAALGLPDTRERLARQVRELLRGLQQEKLLAGTRPEDGFFVRVGAPSEHALRLEVGFAVSKPAQFVVYEVDFRDGVARTRAVTPIDSEHLVG